MSPPKIEAEFDAGDVLIVGAGVTGLLLALEMIFKGRSVTLIDRSGFGAEQSGHSHGYLHHGYIYRRGEAQLVSHLRKGAELWRDILTNLQLDPVSDKSHICFSNELTARAAAASWHAVGLPVEPASDLPSGVKRSQIGTAFVATEATYDFSEFFATAAQNPDLVALRSELKRLHRSGDRITSAVVDLEGRLVRLNAKSFVLAAGDQNARLAETATRFGGRAIVRSSLMVVMRSPTLPPLSVVMPENETYGLFVVSRPQPRGNIWLASNFVSFAGGTLSEEAVDRWLCAIVDKLVANCGGVADPSVEWGVYEAQKAELRDDPQAMGAHAAETYDMSNLQVLAPTKLTLAPLLAREVAAQLDGQLAHQPKIRGESITGPALTAGPERWSTISLQGREQFFEPDDRRPGWSRLHRYARPRSTVV